MPVLTTATTQELVMLGVKVGLEALLDVVRACVVTEAPQLDARPLQDAAGDMEAARKAALAKA